MSPPRFVMYIVIPRSLKMSAGKVGATCGHAVQLVMQNYWRMEEDILKARVQPKDPANLARDSTRYANMRAWLESSYAKIILGASDQEFEMIRSLDDAVSVVDIGLKEVAPGSVTAVGFWPMLKTEAASIIQELRPF